MCLLYDSDFYKIYVVIWFYFMFYINNIMKIDDCSVECVNPQSPTCYIIYRYKPGNTAVYYTVAKTILLYTQKTLRHTLYCNCLGASLHVSIMQAYYILYKLSQFFPPVNSLLCIKNLYSKCAWMKPESQPYKFTSYAAQLHKFIHKYNILHVLLYLYPRTIHMYDIYIMYIGTYPPTHYSFSNDRSFTLKLYSSNLVHHLYVIIIS